MSPNALVDTLFVSFHANVPDHLLGHANVLIRAEAMFSLRGVSFGSALARCQLAVVIHFHIRHTCTWRVTLSSKFKMLSKKLNLVTKAVRNTSSRCTWHMAGLLPSGGIRLYFIDPLI